MNKTTSTILRTLVVSTALALASASVAAADEGPGFNFGEVGKESQAQRTVTVVMRDLTYEPETVTVQPGETIRFVLKNESELLHEFSLGTPEMHAEHQKEMAEMMEHGMITATTINQEMMGMDHLRNDDSNGVLLEPGKTGELVWKFAEAAQLEFACNIPGHYESGMVGQVKFTR